MSNKQLEQAQQHIIDLQVEIVNLRAALAAASARAEAAERELSDERGHKDVIYAGFQAAKQRHAELEAKLAAVPAESLQRIFDAWRMRGQPLQYDMDAAFRWLAQQSEAQP